MVMAIGVELQLTESPQSKEADGKLHAEVEEMISSEFASTGPGCF